MFVGNTVAPKEASEDLEVVCSSVPEVVCGIMTEKCQLGTEMYVIPCHFILFFYALISGEIAFWQMRWDWGKQFSH
jgi:hypothetical protein